MKKKLIYPRLFLFFLVVALSSSCGKRTSAPEETKDLVFMVNLVDDEQKVKEYLAYHKKVWPEVEAGFRKAGYKKINIYRFNRSLVMIITVSKNADIDKLGQVAEAYDKKCKEWNQRMAPYQVGIPGTAKGQKWVKTELLYSFHNQ